MDKTKETTTLNPKVAPNHYQAKESFGGVDGSAEFIEWMVACRGVDFVLNHMIAEMQTKTQRLYINQDINKAFEDVFKIEQACRVVHRLLKHKISNGTSIEVAND